MDGVNDGSLDSDSTNDGSLDSDGINDGSLDSDGINDGSLTLLACTYSHFTRLAVILRFA